MSPVHVRLRKLREAKKMSQPELARASGVPQQTISRIETADRPNATLDVLERLADALSCSVHDLIEHVPRKRAR